MDVGRMSVVADPTGAVLHLWQAKKRIGAGVRNEPGVLCWSEIFTTDTEAAGKFYATTLGWQTKAVDMGPMGTYTLFKIPGDKTNAAGMMQMPPRDIPNIGRFAIIEDPTGAVFALYKNEH